MKDEFWTKFGKVQLNTSQTQLSENLEFLLHKIFEPGEQVYETTKNTIKHFRVRLKIWILNPISITPLDVESIKRVQVIWRENCSY